MPSVTFTPAAFQHHPSLSLRDYKCRKDDDRCDGDDIYHGERFNPLPRTTRRRYKTHIFGLSNYDANTDNTYAGYNEIPQNITSVLHTMYTITNKHIRMSMALHWRHNDHDAVTNLQPHGCLLNRLFRRRSKKTSKLRVTGPCVGNSPGPVNSPHKGPGTREMFPFADVIMDLYVNSLRQKSNKFIFIFKINLHMPPTKTAIDTN